MNNNQKKKKIKKLAIELINYSKINMIKKVDNVLDSGAT